MFSCFTEYGRLFYCGSVGADGFEPSTSWSRTKRASQLRYAPYILPPLQLYFVQDWVQWYLLVSCHPLEQKLIGAVLQTFVSRDDPWDRPLTVASDAVTDFFRTHIHMGKDALTA